MPLAPIDQPAGALTLTAFGPDRLRIYRRFAAPPATLFAAWHDTARMPLWMGMDGHEMTRAEEALRPGGTGRYEWRGTGGEVTGLSAVFTDVEAPTRTVHREIFDADWTGGEVLVTTLMIPADGGTLMTMELHYTSSEARDAVLASPMGDGLEAGYAQLEALLVPA